ncbi:MAG TPA: quinolinate synthase [Deltaproteobacteria bacterium]|nr:MAG: quinolinate synthase [Deltaproteobacteria bacterium GWA2_55_82]OGQ62715.1 MAG: quinolinate synthase [Deltaproteobacteria bacterium RIFCSPLOWO2_02_FULL_55_12]OIJ74308.1 MAG: quinolinate synthase [Deltaproteobacteria bacterium GWC2_55_46]HBG46947.1 quinolinate synthase [Deltaproteobacteria bacterium]HCY10995.1 quinolinate synthase [Deltaproteobacteria bacterium]
MEKEELKKRVRALLKERNAIMIAHNYQRDEVQAVADITGDSLALSQAAAESPARVIVFCGVHFMAESAAILSPDKTVIMPRMDAGCPMADMITPEDLAREKENRPGVPVVAYVNTSAAVKALSDICCTSANAVKVVDSLAEERVYMIPDRNLSHYVSLRTKKKLEWWDGYCPTHERLTVKDVLKAKEENPGALFVCHPECNPEVVKLADHVCSTSGMYRFAKTSDAKTFIIGTEMGILYKLRTENPDKKFILPSRALICPNMKLTTLEDVEESLIEMKNVVTVPEDVREKAKATLDRMMRVPRDF